MGSRTDIRKGNVYDTDDDDDDDDDYHYDGSGGSDSSYDEYGDSSDTIPPQLRGKSGLHAGQRPTRGRLANPGRYTDRSLRKNMDRSLPRRRRYVTGTGRDKEFHAVGLCTNSYGNVKKCEDLLTDHNYRVTFMMRDVLPLNLLLSMVFDVSRRAIARLNRASLMRYYFRLTTLLMSYDRTKALGLDGEHINAGIMAKFVANVVQVGSRIDMADGDAEAVEVLARKYAKPDLFGIADFERLIEKTLPRVAEDSVPKNMLSLYNMLRESVRGVSETDVRLWGVVTNIDEPSSVQQLRVGNAVNTELMAATTALDNTISALRLGDREEIAVTREEQDDDYNSYDDRSDSERV